MTDTEKDLFKVIQIMVDETPNMIPTALDPGVKLFLDKIKEKAAAGDVDGLKALFSQQFAAGV